MSNLIGHSLGRYQILEPLGEGGMAIVYKAYDTRLESEVAVKVIRIERLAPEILQRAMKRFEREAKSLAQLTHPNLVKVVDYGEYEGQPYLVMPYLPGGTLKQKMKGQPMPWQEAARLLIPIARSLEYAHKRGLIHRDVKPSNILITESGEPMLTDFGVAKIIDEESTLDLTGTSAAVGTPEYMAPEQATSKYVDHRADIYALGIVFYEMVTGRRPFQADTPLAVLFKQASEPLPRPTQFLPTLPDAVEKILLKALAKRPEDRYQGMGEVVHAMESLLSGTASAVEPQPAQPAQPVRPPERRLDTQVAINQNEDATVEDSPAPGVQRLATQSAKQPSKPSGFLRYWPLAVGGVVICSVVLVALIFMNLGQDSDQGMASATTLPTNVTVKASPIPTLMIDPQLIVDAQMEGALTTIALPHDWCNYGEIISTFSEKYGISINELNPDVGSGDEIEAIRANIGNNGSQAPDVIDIGIAFVDSAKAEGLLAPYQVSTWDSIPAKLKDAQGYWYGDYYGTMVFLVNTDVQPNIPRGWTDLLNPAYRGQIALSGDPRKSNQAINAVFAAGLTNGGSLDNAQPGLDFFAQLNQAGNLLPLIANDTKVASGETPIRLMWDYLVFPAQDSFAGNPNTEVVYPENGRIASWYVQAISAYAPHPNAAKLWMEFLYSDEGQLLWMKGYCHPIRESDLLARGVIPADLLAKFPSVSGLEFPSAEQLAAARTIITENWDKVVGADIH